MRRYELLALGTLLLASGCRDVMGLPLPGDAVPMHSVPAVYRAWWDQVEACAGRRRFLEWIRWYQVPNASYFLYNGVAYDGYWLSHPDRIIIAESHMTDALVVRHEMLHALLHSGDHAPEYFDRRCGTLVSNADGRSVHGAS